MTRTATRLAAAEITLSFVSFCFSSSSSPRNPSAAQIRAREGGAFSLISSEHKRVDFSAATSPPIYFSTGRHIGQFGVDIGKALNVALPTQSPRQLNGYHRWFVGVQ